MTVSPLTSTQRFIRARQSLLFPILDVLLNLFNWGFHVLVSWFLLPQSYGELNSLLALLSLVMVLGVSLQILTARHVAAEGIQVAPSLQRLALYASGISCGLGVLCIPILMWLTRSNAFCILIVLCIFFLNAILSVQRGMKQGQTTFLSLNGSFYLEVIVKLLATAMFLYFWRTPEAALLGVAAGMAFSLFLALRGTNMPELSQRYAAEPIKPWLNRLSPVFAASFFLYFFSSIDMLMVNRLIPSEAGIYAVAIKYGQILFFAALSVGTVFIPHLSKARGDTAHFKSLALRLIGLLGIASIAALLASWTVLPITVVPVFGLSYVEAGMLIPWAMIAYGLLSLCFCLVNILVVSEQKAYLLMLLSASVALVISLSIHHHTLQDVLQVMTIIYGILFLSLSGLIAKKFKEMSNATHS